MKAPYGLKMIGLVTIGLSILLGLAYLVFQHPIQHFLEVYVSPHHQITPAGMRQFVTAYYFMLALLFGVGFGFFKAQDASWRSRLKQVILSEPLCRLTPSRVSRRWGLVVATLMGLYLVVSIWLWYRAQALFQLPGRLGEWTIDEGGSVVRSSGALAPHGRLDDWTILAWAFFTVLLVVIILFSLEPSRRWMLAISTVGALCLTVSMIVSKGHPFAFQVLYLKAHSLFDNSVIVNMAFSAGLLGVVVWKLRNEPKVAQWRKVLIPAYLVLAVLCVVYLGETIGWGQDFFYWQTPGSFAGNTEHRTTLHNFFNAYFSYAYAFLVVVLLIVLVAIWMEFDRRWQPLGRFLLPHPSLIGMSLVIGFVAVVWFTEQDLLEQLMGFFVLFYCLRLFLCFRSKDLLIER
jgi:hypothetical protein